MDFNRYTTKAAEAIQTTMQLSGKLKHQAMEPLHLLFALLQQEGGLVNNLLSKLICHCTDPQGNKYISIKILLASGGYHACSS